MDGVKNFLLLALSMTLATGLAARADEDSDSRTPVVVKTKRSSIIPRSLPRLTELAEQNSPAIKAAKADLDTAKLNYEISARQWYPTLDLKTDVGLRGSNPTDPAWPQTPWQSNFDLTANETLYDNGTALTKWEIARNAYDRALVEYELARDQQLLKVANAWYDWSAALENREILENNRDMLRRQHNVLEVQYKQGIKTKRDVLRIETEMRRLELDVLNSDNDIDLDFQKMSAFVGVSREELQKEDIEGDEAKPFMKMDDRMDDLKPEDHRKARIFKFLEKESSLATRMVERNYWPQVSVTGTAGYHNQDYIYNSASTGWDMNRKPFWSGIVTLTYNLWDWGVRSRQLEVARVAESKVISTDKQALLDLSSDLRNVMLQLHSFRENVKMTRELLVLEQQSYAILEAEYRNGRAQYLDLITNLKSFIDARSKFIASYYGLKKQQILYYFHQGVLYENLRKR